MAILTVGSHFKAAYELYSHVAVAEASGMSKAKIATVASGSRPAELSEIEGCAYDVAHALTQGGVLPEACYSYAFKLFGQHGTNELIYLVGVYCLVAVTLNGFNMPVPERE